MEKKLTKSKQFVAVAAALLEFAYVCVFVCVE